MRRFQPALSQPPRSASHGVRGALDALVQGSLVDLFAAYAVALAPLPRSARAVLPSLSDICGSVTFTHPSASGRVTLCVPSAVLDDMSRGSAGALRSDWARELTNQLTGRIKNRLLPFNVRLQLGASAVADAAQVASHLSSSPDSRVYAARTLRGQVLVLVDGLPHESELTYVGSTRVAAEGDAILF
jgi:hypothetical protein